MQVNSVLVIGIGNDYRGDDRVGLVVVRTLGTRSDAPPDMRMREQSGEGTELMAAWQDAAAVILIDAIASGDAPGTIFRLDARKKSVPLESLRCSTHAFGVAEAIELARALNQLPPRLIVYGIEGENLSAGEELSPAVEQSARIVVDRVLQEVRGLLEKAG